MKYSVTPEKLFALWNLLTFWKLTHCLIFKAAAQRCSLGKLFWKYATKSQENTNCRSAISVKQQKNFVEITLRHGCSPANLLHVFRTTFLKNLSGWLLLDICTSQASSTFSKMSFWDFPWVMLSHPSNWLARFKIFAMPFILLTRWCCCFLRQDNNLSKLNLFCINSQYYGWIVSEIHGNHNQIFLVSLQYPDSLCYKSLL